ncbi:MAG: VOC family protein [Helicobacteraceae bacterium]|jgi:catechol 2,3-dioxygenase-like lactoylglutathione lyase family enzyme|nr:VOC family protein [Helicobacteraceae bacterium]
MQFRNPMIIVADVERSKRFYADVLNQSVSLDLGEYVVMGGISMMSRQTWSEDTRDVPPPPSKVGHTFELYFEESDLDGFVAALRQRSEIVVFTPLGEAPWGQRAIRFLDPDGYAIEVAEPMEDVVSRLLASGLSVEEAAERSMMPIEFVQACQA